MEIMVEFHSLWNLPTALKIAKALEPFKPMWFEDPIVMNSPQALAEYARSTNVWVCASETLGSRWPYKDFLDRDAMHVVMVDLSWAGGLTEGRKIASMAATYHRPSPRTTASARSVTPLAIHMAFMSTQHVIQESVRAFLHGILPRTVTVVPEVVDRIYPSDGRRRAVHRAFAGRIQAQATCIAAA